MNAVEARDLRKSFGQVRAVDGVSITIPQGEIFGFLGPNGAGKTTTIRMLTGVLVPDSGSVSVFGKDVHRDPLGAKLDMGVIPENGDGVYPPWFDLVILAVVIFLFVGCSKVIQRNNLIKGI